jgi:peptidyl-prolyl cis-trans isomerase C
MAGVAAGEVMYRSEICRDAIGRCFGRGRLRALIHGKAIYQTDVEAAMAAENYFAGNKPGANSEEAVLQRLIAQEHLRQALQTEAVVPETEVQHDLDLVRHEFADDNFWTARMAESGRSAPMLRQQVRESLAGRRLIEQAISSQLLASDAAIRAYYTQHPTEFGQPMRWRASHIFLAAPPETPPEVVQAKQKLIGSLGARLRDGEDFGALVWEESEDEASKLRGGDLGYFSPWRMPPDFFAKVSKLKVGETSAPFRSLLGFHIVRVTEIKPARQMTLEEAHFETAARLTNQGRREAVTAFAARLVGSSALRRGWFWN